MIEFNGADINFYFKFENNFIYNNEEIIIVGYIVDYDTIKEIYDINIFYNINPYICSGKFDRRTYNGLILFDKESIGNDISRKDKYYLVLVWSNYYEYSSGSFQIHSASKDSYFSPLSRNKYISGSIHLIKSKIHSQKYYIREDKTQNFINEFSSNYKNMKLVFNNDTIKCKYMKTEGGINKYYITILYNESNYNDIFFEVNSFKDINENKEIELEKAILLLNIMKIV